MNRDDVIRDNLVDRYLLGQLSEPEADSFEVFYLSCEETVDELEIAEKMIGGFRATEFGRAAALPRDAASGSVDTGYQNRNWAAIAASFVAAIALSTSFYLYGKLEAERSLANTSAINIPIIHLAVVRSAGNARAVEVSADPVRIAFALDIGVPEADTYRVDAENAAGKVIWSGKGLVPDDFDALTFSMPPSTLKPGEYQLIAVPTSQSGNSVRFPIAVIPRN